MPATKFDKESIKNTIIGKIQRYNGLTIDEASPQQIYRAYARLPHDATVTEQQAEEMERAMDKLIFAPAQLDYTAQLERHTKVKQQEEMGSAPENLSVLHSQSQGPHFVFPKN